jgi:hypothetical protein
LRRPGGSHHGLGHECLETESTEKLPFLCDFVDDPTCSVTYDESLSDIFVVWKQYAPSSAQLRFAHECILHLLKTHGACKLLGDDTALITLQPEDRSWVVQDWRPRALAAGLKFAASKSPESYSGKASVKSVQAAFPPGLVTQTFDDIADARRWLQSVSTWVQSRETPPFPGFIATPPLENRPILGGVAWTLDLRLLREVSVITALGPLVAATTILTCRVIFPTRKYRNGFALSL